MAKRNLSAVQNQIFKPKVKFNGALRCGESIVINVPAKVDPNALCGQIDTNWACINMMTSLNGSYTNNSFPAEAVAQIKDCQLSCCDSSFHVSYNGNYNQNIGGTNFAIPNFNLRTFHDDLIHKVRASIVNFAYDTQHENCADCMPCNINSENLGTLDWDANSPTLGGLTKATSTGNREMIWDVENNGVPTLFDNGESFSLLVRIPDRLDIPCCCSSIKLCVKFELTDENCKTCEVIRCISFRLPNSQDSTNGNCPSTPSDNPDR